MRRRDVLALAVGAAFAAAPGRKAGAVHGAKPLPGARPARVALVLGGGGCRGHGHIGVIRVLEKHGLKPDLVVGTSSGSLVGALYAAGMSSAQIERYGQQLGANLLRDWIFPKLGLFGGDAIRRFVVERIGSRSIESLPIRFAAVTTDLKTGEMTVLDRGDLGLAVQASASIPGLLDPARIGGRLFVDGNLSSPLPVEAARRLGARRVIAVDVTFPPEQANLGDAFDALYQAFSILTRKLALEERIRADLVIEPRLPEHNSMDPATLQMLADAGERAAVEALPELLKLFAARAT